MLWPLFAMALTAPAPPAQSCLQATDGNIVARVQSASNELIERLKPNPYYGGAWFEYRPCYRIVLALTNDVLRPAVLAAAPEHLRPYIGFARINLSHAEREAAGRAIREVSFGPGIDAVFIDGDPRQPFRIGVRTEADAAIVRSLIPERYRAITVVVPGGYAEPILESSAREKLDPPPMPGEYVGPSDAEDRAMYPKRATLGAAELQLFVIPFGRKVRSLPGFSDLYIEHDPRWHVVVAFTSPPDRDKVLALAPHTIRDRIVIRTATRTASQISGDLDAITAAVNKLKVDYTGGYDPKTQRFHIMVGAPAMIERVTAVLPDSVRADTDVMVGALPVPEMGSPRSPIR
jgi:hypothetical protein